MYVNKLYVSYMQAIPILTFCLGSWQIHRRKWKLNLMEEVERKFRQEPRDLPTKYVFNPIIICFSNIRFTNKFPPFDKSWCHQ